MGRKIESPCIDVCTLDPAKSVCIGCLRTIEEIVAWASYSDEVRSRIMKQLPDRKRP
jgi:predicted Fe-S protein YdhL (DUF1289 family)